MGEAEDVYSRFPGCMVEEGMMMRCMQDLRSELID